MAEKLIISKIVQLEGLYSIIKARFVVGEPVHFYEIETHGGETAVFSREEVVELIELIPEFLEEIEKLKGKDK